MQCLSLLSRVSILFPLSTKNREDCKWHEFKCAIGKVREMERKCGGNSVSGLWGLHLELCVGLVLV